MRDVQSIGQELIDMGQRILASHSKEESMEDEESEDMGDDGDMPKKALIIASLKRKIGE